TKRRTVTNPKPKLLETVNDGELDDVLSQINATMSNEGVGWIAESPGEAGVTEIDELILCAKPPVRIVERVLQAAANKPAGMGVVPAALEAEILTRYGEPPTNVGVAPCSTTGEVRQPVAESIAELATKG